MDPRRLSPRRVSNESIDRRRLCRLYPRKEPKDVRLSDVYPSSESWCSESLLSTANIRTCLDKFSLDSFGTSPLPAAFGAPVVASTVSTDRSTDFLKIEFSSFFLATCLSSVLNPLLMAVLLAVLPLLLLPFTKSLWPFSIVGDMVVARLYLFVVAAAAAFFSPPKCILCLRTTGTLLAFGL